MTDRPLESIRPTRAPRRPTRAPRRPNRASIPHPPHAPPRHCEERSDAAIQFHPLTFFRRIDHTQAKPLDCHVGYASSQ